MLRKLKPNAAAKAVPLAALTLLILGCSGGPEFNPLPPGSGSPTATSVPVETATATATPAPTDAIRISGLLSPETNPDGYLFDVFNNLVRYDAVSVASQFYVRDISAEGTPEAAPEVLVRVEGEYSVPFVDSHSDGGFILSPPDFRLTFSRPGAQETVIEVSQGRVAMDTTGNDLQVYSSYAEMIRDPDRDWDKAPSMAMFLSLALTGGQSIEYAMYELVRFEEGSVRLVENLEEDGSGLRVFEATRSKPNGDNEEWTFWIDAEHRAQRISLTLTNDGDPARLIRNAELEFTGYGEWREPPPPPPVSLQGLPVVP